MFVPSVQVGAPDLVLGSFFSEALEMASPPLGVGMHMTNFGWVEVALFTSEELYPLWLCLFTSPFGGWM